MSLALWRERAGFDDRDLQCRSLSSIEWRGRRDRASRRYTVSLRWKTTATVRARMRRSEVKDQCRA